MKKIILALFLISNVISAQKLKGYGTLGVNLNKEFKNSFYQNIGVGLEYELNNLIRPEAGATFYFGSFNVDDKIDFATGFITNKNYLSFTGINISISPKITIDISSDFEKKAFFQILPKFNLTKIQAESNYYSLNSKKDDYVLTDSEKTTSFRNSIGIGVGIYCELSDKNSNALALNLNYENIDFGHAIADLKHGKSNFHTNQVIGISLQYYFGFAKKK